MSETTLQVDIVSAEGAIYSGSVNMVFTMGISGELGIAPGHAQLLTMLKPGPVRLLTQGGQLEEVLYVSGGILEVQPFGVTILADTAVRAADLDEAIALEAKQKAENMLKKKQDWMTYSTAASELARAAAQISAIHYLKKRDKL